MSTTDPLVLTHPTPGRLVTLAGARLLTAVQDALAARGEAHVVLTGGSMGSAVVAGLADHPAHDVVDWSRVHFWWGDERYLPSGDPERNDTQNESAGLASLGADPEHVHRVAGPDESSSVEDSAARYGEELRAAGAEAFDVVLLGVGPDGHIASLFPGHPAQLTEGETVIAVHDSPKPPATRVSLTAGCLSRSRQVWFVVSGEDKAEAVAKGVDEVGPEEGSTGLVRGRERTLWLIDAAAGGRLSG